MVDFSSIGRRVATQAVNNGLQKVAGNLPGLLGFGQNGRDDSSDTNVLNQPKVDTKMFSFQLTLHQSRVWVIKVIILCFILTNN